MLDQLFPVTAPIPPLTEEWHKARLGRITASSRASRIVSGNPKVLNAVLAELRYEIENQEPYSTFTGNRHTEHGQRWEKQAFLEYDLLDLEMRTKVYEPGFMVHPELTILGATPDFLEGDDTTGQIKCPSKGENHLKMWHHGIDKGYVCQVNTEALVTGRGKIVFISYDPRAVTTQRLFVQRLEPDEGLQKRVLENARLIQHALEHGGIIAKPTIDDGVPSLF